RPVLVDLSLDLELSVDYAVDVKSRDEDGVDYTIRSLVGTKAQGTNQLTQSLSTKDLVIHWNSEGTNNDQ
ncbi:hypothetical protein PFISCL1PPCAC_18775, partial [Pristionchus fissidentatus]